jgi:hypothetical protein
MSFLRTVLQGALLVGLVAVLFLSGLALPVSGRATSYSPGSPVGGVVVHFPASAAGPLVPPAARVLPAAKSAAPAASQPEANPGWHSNNFFNDVQVTFSIPGVGALPNFSVEPVTNSIPLWAPGFWMNISTDRPIVYANVTIWGTQWPVQNVTQAIFGYDPSAGGALRQMLINTTSPNKAVFFFDDYRYFWPGDTVGFNLTVTALNSTPETIYSANEYSFPMGCSSTSLQACDYATWIFDVGSPWVSPDFASSVELTTSPNVFGTPPLDPNSHQSLQVIMTAIAPPGLAVGTIPQAILYWNVLQNGLIVSTSSEPFVATNQTTVQLAYPIGPYPNSTVEFNVTAYLPWEGGAIDRLYSPMYTFNWSRGGGWNSRNQALSANMELTTVPNVLPPAPGAVGAGQPVNVTIHETQQNITISSGQIDFVFNDGLGTHSGVLSMVAATQNTSYCIIPGLPAGSSLTFFVEAKDINNTPVFSDNITYSAGHAPAQPYPTGRTVFFWEALDVAGTGLVASFPFTLSNGSWSESYEATPLGFGAPVVPNQGSNYLTIGLGDYVLNVQVFGRTYSATVDLTNQTPFTVVFYVASTGVSESSQSALPILPITAVVGLAAASISLAMILPWFLERRKRMEEEQRRITL